MLRRSDFIAATYALSFVLANFGIAIAARMPMMTTTIRSSISVKPFLLRTIVAPCRMIGSDARLGGAQLDPRLGTCQSRAGESLRWLRDMHLHGAVVSRRTGFTVAKCRTSGIPH